MRVRVQRMAGAAGRGGTSCAAPPEMGKPPWAPHPPAAALLWVRQASGGAAGALPPRAERRAGGRVHEGPDPGRIRPLHHWCGRGLAGVGGGARQPKLVRTCACLHPARLAAWAGTVPPPAPFCALTRPLQAHTTTASSCLILIPLSPRLPSALPHHNPVFYGTTCQLFSSILCPHCWNVPQQPNTSGHARLLLTAHLLDARH